MPCPLGSSRRSATLAIGCAALSLALAGGARAQSNEDFGIWVGGFAQGKFPTALNNANGSWRYWLDVQLRFGDDASRYSQGIFRPGIGYALNRSWIVYLGYAWIKTQPPYASTTTYEQRLWEQASWSGPLGPFRLASRTRLEQRFVSTGSETGWRLREMLKLTLPLGGVWSAVAYDEYFFNLNSTNYGAVAGADRNRFFVGPGLTLSKSLYTEIGYLHQRVFQNNAPDKSDNILAVSLFWTP